MCNSFSYDMIGVDEEKGLREVKGERCWDRRVRRKGLVSILFRARIMRGRAKERIREIENNFDLSFINTGSAETRARETSKLKWSGTRVLIRCQLLRVAEYGQ